ncbi:MAG: ribosomal protein S18-alanine N-acetyltransferase [Candidatus Bathyarchaeia archaeon]
MPLQVKQATIEDLEKLYTIEKECFTFEAFSKGQIASLLLSPNSVSLVAKENNEILGFIIGIIYDETVGHIFTLDVAIKHRRKGVGLKLLRELEKIFREKGVKACFLEVRMDNLAARQLYEKQGYREIEELKNFYRKGVHGIRLKKDLTRPPSV